MEHNNHAFLHILRICHIVRYFGNSLSFSSSLSLFHRRNLLGSISLEEVPTAAALVLVVVDALVLEVPPATALLLLVVADVTLVLVVPPAAALLLVVVDALVFSILFSNRCCCKL